MDISGAAQVSQGPPNFTPLQESPAQSSNPNNSNKSLFIAIGILLSLVILAIVFYFVSRNFSRKVNTSFNQPPQNYNANTNPYEALSAALNKTIAAKTAYLEYKTKVTSHVTSTKTSITQTLHNNVDGSISGSTDGKTTAVETKIYNDAAPDRSLNISVLSTESGEWYIRNAQTAPKWQKLTKEQYEQFNAGPIDASLFGLNILGTIFSKNQALFKSFNKDSVTSLGDETSNSTTYSKYRADVSTPDFINALSKDKDVTQKEVDEVRIILKDAILTVTYYVDKNSGYVGKLNIDAKSLAQISTPESQQLGISVKHDVILDASLSRFGVPTNITAPSSAEVLGVSTVVPAKPKLPL